MNKEILLKAVDVHKSYKIGKRDIKVLRGIDFSVNKNEWVAILGASGSGKTALLNILGALETPDAGSVSCGDAPYSAMSRRAKATFRCEKIGFVFQSYHMFPELSILEKVKVPARVNKANSAMISAELATLPQNLSISSRLNTVPRRPSR